MEVAAADMDIEAEVARHMDVIDRALLPCSCTRYKMLQRSPSSESATELFNKVPKLCSTLQSRPPPCLGALPWGPTQHLGAPCMMLSVGGPNVMHSEMAKG